MNFIRKIINADKLRKIISIPDDMKNQKVEVIILPVLESGSSKKKQKKFDPDDFSGVMKIKDIDKKIQSVRDEWERV